MLNHFIFISGGIVAQNSIRVMIKKRYSHFEGVMHAHSVSHGEDIFGQISLDIAVESPIETISAVAARWRIEIIQHKGFDGIKMPAESC